MKNAESFIVWTGNIYGDGDRYPDIWADVSEAEGAEEKAIFFDVVNVFMDNDRGIYIS